MNKNHIDEIYDDLVIKKVRYSNDADLYARVKAKREAAEVKYTSDGRVQGKNAEQRKANLAKLVNYEQQTEKKAERIMQQSRLELELAQIEVDRVRLLIRLLDITTRGK